MIIKLGAMGDVIRSTPILRRLWKEYPSAEIYWLTDYPEFIPKKVDRVLTYSIQDVTTVQQIHFDLLINLDKDLHACALAESIPAERRKGYGLKNSRPWPVDDDAVEKFLSGLFDDVSRANRKSYVEELFQICGFDFRGEKYLIDLPEIECNWDFDRTKPIVGLNTGCGGRWKSRLWPEENWIELAKKLKAHNLTVLLLGGKQEHEKNIRISRESGAVYPGHFPLQQFMHLVNQCDLVVTAVTMAMHIVIGLNKKLVLFNNTFNKHEFELYGLGEILEPEMDCDCYYAPVCPNDCMKYIYPDRVLETCLKLLHGERAS